MADKYEALEEMFNTQGWQDFVEEAEQAVEVRKDLLTRLGNIEAICFTQGEIQQLRAVINMQDAVRLMQTAEKQLIDDEET